MNLTNLYAISNEYNNHRNKEELKKYGLLVEDINNEQINDAIKEKMKNDAETLTAIVAKKESLEYYERIINSIFNDGLMSKNSYDSTLKNIQTEIFNTNASFDLKMQDLTKNFSKPEKYYSI